MPFPMVHLFIASLLLESPKCKIESSEFLAGSLAPDSVHFRPNYSGSYKVKSHLCVNTWKWGESTDNEAWKSNVIQFFYKNKNTENYSFIYGYCAHILADVAWNEKFWIPFRANHIVDSNNYNGSLLHQDCYEIDSILYNQLPKKIEIWSQLDKARVVEIDGIVSSDETQKMIKSILSNQFSNRTINEKNSFNHININQVTNFIKEEAVNIANILFEE